MERQAVQLQAAGRIVVPLARFARIANHPTLESAFVTIILNESDGNAIIVGRTVNPTG